MEKYTRKDAIEQRRLEGRVYRLECLVHDLCCAIVYCDDMALMEREILQIGEYEKTPSLAEAGCGGPGVETWEARQPPGAQMAVRKPA